MTTPPIPENPKDAAPVTNTGGAGFAAEDKQVAYLLAQCLAERAVLFDHGAPLVIDRLDFQTKGDGWYLDDVLISCRKPTGATARIAMSIKSNQQFGVHTAPGDFVEAAWKQLLIPGAPFDRTSDFLALLTGPVAQPTLGDVNWLMDLARTDSPAVLHNRIESSAGFCSADRKSLYESFACPNTFPEGAACTQPAAFLLSRCWFSTFDFDVLGSARLSEALKLCQDVLVDPSQAQTLWDLLLTTAHELRPKGGSIDRSELLARTIDRVRLKHAPSVRMAFEALDRFSQGCMDNIRTTIGDGFSLASDGRYLPQDIAVGSNAALKALLGTSGCGKSGMLRQWAAGRSNSWGLWIDAAYLENGGFATLLGQQPVNLTAMLKANVSPEAHVIIDAADRIYSDTGFAVLAGLLRQVTTPIADRRQPIVVMSCQSTEWHRIVARLRSLNFVAQWDATDVSERDDINFQLVGQQYPQLRPVLLESMPLSRVMRHLKILDLAAAAIKDGKLPDTHRWTGESSIAQWFWQLNIDDQPDGPALEAFFTFLATDQGDEQRLLTPLDTLRAEHLQLIPRAERLGVVRRTNGSLRFSHDLYGDWFRLRRLVAESGNTKPYLDTRLHSPLWRRALRTYSTYLLEQSADSSAWSALLSSFQAGSSGNPGVIPMVEGIALATSAGNNLAQLSSLLLKEDGALLSTLLRAFSYAASYPDSQLAAMLAKAGASGTYAAAAIRKPMMFYWPPILMFLDQHRAQVAEVAPKDVLDICSAWLALRSTAPFREHAARIVFAVVDHQYEARDYDRNLRGSDEFDLQLSRAALQTLLTPLHADAKQLVDRLAGLAALPPIKPRTPESGHQPPLSAFAARQQVLASLSFPDGFGREHVGPWPHGPQYEVAVAFRNVCLSESLRLIALMHGEPAYASRLILAACIREPGDRDRGYGSHSDSLRGDEGLELEEPFHGWRHTFYDQGPFLQFLALNEEWGLRTILTLVEHATQRWVDWCNRRYGVTPILPVRRGAATEIWVGDSRLFYVHRAMPLFGHLLASALMALERWLAELEDEAKREQLVKQLLEQSKSQFMLGVLMSVGKRFPSLLQGPLLPYLASLDLLHADQQHVLTGERHQIQAFWRDQAQLKAAREWHEQPFRKTELYRFAMHIFIQHESSRSLFEAARADWQFGLEQQIPAMSAMGDYARRLIHEFDISMWTQRMVADGSVEWEYIPPEDLSARAQQAREDLRITTTLISLPIKFAQALEGSATFTSEQLEQVWTELQRVAQTDDPSNAGLTGFDRRDTLCGGAAVLLRKHSDWLGGFPDRLQWCDTTVIETVSTTPPSAQLEYIEALGSFKWPMFCAQALPAIWARRDDPDMRLAIARVALGPYYSAMEAMVVGCAQTHTLEKSKKFQLVNLLLRYAFPRGQMRAVERLAQIRREQGPPGRQTAAYARAGVYIEQKAFDVKRFFLRATLSSDRLQSTLWAHHMNRFRNRPDRQALKDWVNDLGGAFKANSMDTQLLDVSTLFPEPLELSSERRGYGTFGGRQREEPRYPDVDYSVLKAASAWVGTDIRGADATARGLAFRHSQNLVKLLAAALARVPADEDISGYPTDFDSEVMGQAALLINLGYGTTDVITLWEPLLKIGPRAEHWLHNFLDSFYATALGADPIPRSLTGLWPAMLEHALNNPQWKAGAKRLGHSASESWYFLVGLGTVARRLWNAQHAPFVASHAEYWRRWFGVVIRGERNFLPGLLSFFLGPAATAIRLEALLWIDTEVADYSELLRRDERGHVGSALVAFIAALWQQNRDEIRGRPELFAALNRILTVMVSRHSIEARELEKIIQK